MEEDWLDTVKESLSILRESYPEGAGTHGYRFGPTLREEEIRAWEQVLHIRLPDDYRLFLQYIGNGGCGPNGGLKSFAPGEELSHERRLRIEAFLQQQKQNVWEHYYKQNLDPFLSNHPDKEALLEHRIADFQQRLEADFAECYAVKTDIFGSPQLLCYPHKRPEIAQENFLELTHNDRLSFILVLSGTEQGYVWAIQGGADPAEFAPRDKALFWEAPLYHRLTFKDWYLAWLRALLRTMKAKRKNEEWLATPRSISPSDTAWLESVRVGVAELAEHYGGHWRQAPICFAPSPTEADLAAREQELGIRLPEDYRNFLLHIGNGGFGPGHGLRYFPIKEPGYEPRDISDIPLDRWPEESEDTRPFELRYDPSINPKPENIGKPFPFIEATSEDSMDAQTGYLEIADFGCGSFEILIVAGAEYGHVWGTDDGGFVPYEISYGPRNNLLWEPLRPQRYTFKDWYLDWLEAMLNTARQRGIS